MLNTTNFRDGVSINIGGFAGDGTYSPGIRGQSWTRSWRRLSSLQRTVILLCLCVATMCFIYFSSMYHRDDDESLHLLPRNVPRQSLDDLPRDMVNEMQIEKAKKLDEIRKHGFQNDLDPGIKAEPLEPPVNKQDELAPGMDAHDPQADNQPVNNPQVNPDKEDTALRHGFEAVVEYDYFSPNRQHNSQQKAIIEAFQECWEAYRKHAWGHDEFHPVSKRHSEWFGVGLTILDSIDTIIIMGLKNEYEQAKGFVMKDLTFDKNQDVNLFEITIRVLGGLLSVYHLTGDDTFKTKAVELGDRLLPCFNSPSHVPFSDVNLRTGNAHAPRWGPDSSTSEVTTIQLEFRDLSAVTGDPKYKDAVNVVYNHVHSEPKKDGLVPIFINAQTGKLRNSATISVGARGDSYYEYLLKQWLQTGKTELKYKSDYIEAVEGMKKHLIRKSEPSKLTYIGELMSGRNFSPKMDHLVCFMGGTLALGYLNGLPEEHLDLGKELTRTCYQMYARMPTKLSPEIVYFNQASGAEEDLIVKPLDAHNLLRPETVESLFYLYRITQDEQYREWGWKIFQAFKKYTRIEGFGYSSINNVKNAGQANFRDKLESFFLAETLKYLYLLFSDDPDLIPLDKFVINTEAHPLPIYKSII